MACNVIKWFVSSEFESKNNMRAFLGDRLHVKGQDEMPIDCPVVAIGTSHPTALPLHVDRFIMQPTHFARAPFVAPHWADADPNTSLLLEKESFLMLDDDGFAVLARDEFDKKLFRNEPFRYSHATNGAHYTNLQRYYVADFDHIVSVGPNDNSRYRGRLNAIINYMWRAMGLWSYVVEIATSAPLDTDIVQQDDYGLPKIMRITGFDRKWSGNVTDIISALEETAARQYERENALSPIRLMIELKALPIQVSYQPLAPKSKFDKHLHTKKHPYCLVDDKNVLRYSYPNADALRKKVHEL